MDWPRSGRRSPAALRGIIVATLLWTTSCGDGAAYDQAIAVLVDTSGTYVEEMPEVARILKREVLPNMVPGDTLVLIRIDSESFDKENVEAIQTLDWRPSQANAQKLALAQRLDTFSGSISSSKFTDIRGAMMLASSYLRETGARSRVMLLFSDMREDLPQGATRTFGEDELAGVEIIAMNVKQLRADTADPNGFRQRLASWEASVGSADAASWQILMDPAKLGDLLLRTR